MSKTKRTLTDENSKPEQGITRISVSGYKSLAEECSIEIAPLTILSGANSSGKSSIMQPLLLMKQTLESTYDAGSLKLNGANVRLTSTDQIFSKIPYSNLLTIDSYIVDDFSIAIELGGYKEIKNTFKKEGKNKGLQLEFSLYKINNIEFSISLNMQHEDILNSLPVDIKKSIETDYNSQKIHLKNSFTNNEWSGKFISEKEALTSSFQVLFDLSVHRYKCFLCVDSTYLSLQNKLNLVSTREPSIKYSDFLKFASANGLCESVEKQMCMLIHISGLRGNPERSYPITSTFDEFTGVFENYVASIIHHWKISKDKRLKLLGEALKLLGLTWKVDTKQIDDTQVEVRVGRLKNKGDSQANDMVSIADVGFGLSQTLPVVVALLVAEPEQLVYLEQPEIHLHPRAQANLAQLLVEAANRGVRVVVETHSELLIRRVQSLIAEDKIDAEKVKLHWFSQDDNGFTKVTTAELDDTGAFGDWPEDFSEISLQEESRYLDAAESKLMAV